MSGEDSSATNTIAHLESSTFSNNSLFNFDAPTNILSRTFWPAAEGPASMWDPGPTPTSGSFSLEIPPLGGPKASERWDFDGKRAERRRGTGVPHRGRPSGAG